MPEQFNPGKMEPHEVEEAAEAVTPDSKPGFVEEKYEGNPIYARYAVVSVYTPLEEADRNRVMEIIEGNFSDDDVIDDAYVDIETSSHNPALFVKVNRGGSGSNTNEEVFSIWS